MSKSNFGHDQLLKDQSITDEEVLTQRSSDVFSKLERDRESVTPFAKDMVDNVVTGALSILDISRKEGKPWKDVLAAEESSSAILSGQNVEAIVRDGVDLLSAENQTSNSLPTSEGQRPIVQVMHLQVRDDVICDSVHAEQVAKIVKGLQDIQIGDSAYVLPADGSNIEKQVKRAVRNINSLEFGDLETAQLIICDGQGDVDTSILEGELGPSSNVNYKPQHDGSKISKCFLHKMIEELEDNDVTNPPDHRNKEGIAMWEESEEQFIRIIEGPSDETDSVISVNHQEHDHHMVTHVADDDAMNRSFLNSLSHGQQPPIEGETFVDRSNCSQPRDLLDNYTDEEPYWCTAGLITRVVTPQHGELFANKESETSRLEGNLGVRKNETYVSESPSAAGHAEVKPKIRDQESRVKGKKQKKSFGKRLRKFFSRFTRSKDC